MIKQSNSQEIAGLVNYLNAVPFDVTRDHNYIQRRNFTKAMIRKKNPATALAVTRESLSISSQKANKPRKSRSLWHARCTTTVCTPH